MAKKYVIAGNRDQASQWIKTDLEKRSKAGETTLSWSDYVIVNDSMKLRGVRDPRGVFVGTWRERPDVVEILDALLIACVHVNKELQAIRNSVISKRPTPKTPKIQGLRAESVFIDEAAQMLSDEIDKEVIRQMTQPQQPQAVDMTTMLAQLVAAVQELTIRIEKLEKA